MDNDDELKMALLEDMQHMILFMKARSLDKVSLEDLQKAHKAVDKIEVKP